MLHAVDIVVGSAAPCKAAAAAAAACSPDLGKCTSLADYQAAEAVKCTREFLGELWANSKMIDCGRSGVTVAGCALFSPVIPQLF